MSDIVATIPLAIIGRYASDRHGMSASRVAFDPGYRGRYDMTSWREFSVTSRSVRLCDLGDAITDVLCQARDRASRFDCEPVFGSDFGIRVDADHEALMQSLVQQGVCNAGDVECRVHVTATFRVEVSL